MTITDKLQRERRVNKYRGVVAMILGVFVLTVAAVRGDDHSWQGFLLAGVSFSLGALFLFRASLRAPRS